jgi:signal transduction histidine kinase
MTARTVRALEQLLGGFGTALLALGLLLWTVGVGLASVLVVGLPAVPPALRALHALADRERRRLARWGADVPAPGPRPDRVRAAAQDPTTRRELAWLARHAVAGCATGSLAVLAPLSAVRDLSFPLWWWALPDGWAGPSLGFWVVRDWAGVPPVLALGAAWAAVTVGLAPVAARRQLAAGRRLLASHPDLALRVAELTATRAAARDAHAVELRRIERALHDGAQNRLVATAVLLGAARRSLAGGRAGTDELLGKAQDAAELALSELRAVARSILPPVLADRGLDGAVHSLAAACPVPCAVRVDVGARCPASVEATAYATVAEALTNVARHSGAGHVEVVLHRQGDRLQVRVSDDGRGGAVEGAGTGLTGLRRRVEALDGRWALTSPGGGPTVLEVELPCGS